MSPQSPQITPAPQATASALAIPTSPFSAPWLNNLRRALGRVGTRSTLPAGYRLTTAEKAEIDRQLSTLRRATTANATDRQAIAVELADLFAAFPMQDASVSAARRVAAFSDAIGWAPAWAMRAARLRFIRGEVGGHDGRFAPTPPQLTAVVRQILKPLQDDLADLTRLAEVEHEAEPSPEERARVGARMDELAATLGRKTEAQRRAAAEDALRARAREMGLDDAALDAIPDAPKRSGTFVHAGGSTGR